MNPSDIKYTSVDYYINKFPNKSSENIFDLENLARNFPLDIIKDDKGTYITTGNFNKLEYSEKIGKGSIENLINRPPIGPIPDNFMCTFCLQYGPNYHTVECQNPSTKSLVLTYKGFKSLIKNLDYTGPLKDDIDEYRKGNKLQILKKYFEEDIEKVKEGNKTIIKIPDEAFTEISYDDIVKTKGRDRQAPKTLTVRFSNMVSIYYTFDDKTANIRIYKDGSIDIKNMPQDSKFIEELLTKINKSDSLIKDNYKKLLLKNNQVILDNYYKSDNYSYYYLFHAQFYMFGQTARKEQEINFIELENILESDVTNNHVEVIADEILLKGTSYDFTIISKAKALKGKKILTETLENKVYLINTDDIDITLFLTKYGVFQFTVSSTTVTLNETNDILNELKLYFVNLFNTNNLTEKTYITSESGIYSMHETQDSTVSGLVPPKSTSQRIGTEVCRKTQAGVALQPKPYSWTGTCPAENYAPAIGIAEKYKGGDVKTFYNGKEEQLYYPCCEKLTGKNKEDFIERLKKGFTPQEQERYGIFPDRDVLSGVVVPNSTALGAETEVLLPGELQYTQVEVVSVPKKITNTSEYKVKRLLDSKIFTIPRTSFKRDSRYFRGLNSLNKRELISILMKENMVTMGSKINISKYLDKITTEYITLETLTEKFTEVNYKLIFVPDNTSLVILDYANLDDQHYINLNTNIKIKSSVTFLNGTMIVGYYHESNKEFYPLYLYGTPDIDTSTNILDNNLRGNEDIIQDINYIDNYVEATHYYLTNENNIRLLFVPTFLNNTIYYYDEKLTPPPITVQLINKVGASRYQFGYDNQLFINDSYQVLIPPRISEMDYIKIKGKYDKLTGEIDNLKPLEYINLVKREEKTFEKAKLQFTELFNPINLQFFTIYEGEFLQIGDKKYTYDEDSKLLISPI